MYFIDYLCGTDAWCGKEPGGGKNRLALTLFLSPIAVLDFGSLAAEEYGKIRAELERKGTTIGSMDLLIAGHAKSENLILVTNHTREFVRVEGLKLEDWASSR